MLVFYLVYVLCFQIDMINGYTLGDKSPISFYLLAVKGKKGVYHFEMFSRQPDINILIQFQLKSTF